MINLSKAAISEIRRIQVKHKQQEARLRLGVQAGGCAKLCYTIDFDQDITPGDHIYECDGLSLIVDTQSLNYINGLMLDYSEDLMGGGFRFHNPNAVASCGCGHSFSVQT